MLVGLRRTGENLLHSGAGAFLAAPPPPSHRTKVVKSLQLPFVAVTSRRVPPTGGGQRPQKWVGGGMRSPSCWLLQHLPLTSFGIPVSRPHVSPCTEPLVCSVVLRHQRTPPPPSQHRALPPLLPYPHIPLVNLPDLLLPKVKNSSVRHPRLFCSQRHPNHTVECTGLFRITYT